VTDKPGEAITERARVMLRGYSEWTYLEKDGNDRRPMMRGCTSKLQRELQCGYNVASAIMDALEREGFISAPDAHGNRRLVR
jgi:DNA segregation ATPase FtsK/SpoIIIE-like protein